MASSSQKDSEIEVIINNPEILEIDPTGQFIRFNKLIRIETSNKVYEGLDTYNDIQIAWSKIEAGEIGEAGLKKFCQEAEMWKSLNHRNILKCYTYWTTFSNKNWCRQILRALHYLHSENIIHLDVNADNIVVDEKSGRLADFSVAVYKESSNVCCTTAGATEYRAPEVLSYEYNDLADIHSFGMTVLQMVTYEKIYSEYKNLTDIDDAVKSGVMPVALEQVYDPQLKRFIKRCVAPASQRPSASKLLKDPFLATTDQRSLVKAAVFGFIEVLIDLSVVCLIEYLNK
uniref:non-specific serine/threonine protein kinase n=1 Tax=Chenopodium quinoa TaxID=63459 RepID=A0A803MT62_CHEQI